MTEPSKAAIHKAARLITENYRSEGFVNFTYTVRDVDSPLDRAFARFIDHVSGVAAGVDIRLTEAGYAPNSNTRLELSELILSGPDPLEELKHKPLGEALAILSERGLKLVVESGA